MYKTLLLIIISVIVHITALAKEMNEFSLDCIKISEFEYLILIKNNTHEKVLLPESPKISFQGDTMYANIRLPYKSNSCTFYVYSIDGRSIKSVQPLRSIKPDSVYIQYFGVIPNYATPSSYVEIKPKETYSLTVFCHNYVPPESLILEIEIRKSPSEVNEKKMIFSHIIDSF